MAEVLVLVDQVDGVVKKSTTELLTAARALGEPAAVWVGPGFGDAAMAMLGEFGATSFLSRSGTMTVPIAIGQLMGRPGTLLQQAAFALATLIVIFMALCTRTHEIRRKH